MSFKSLLHTFFTGSTPGAITSDTDNHPFEPCPVTPNCTIQSIRYRLPANAVYLAVLDVMKRLSPHNLHPNSQQLQIDAVFRIRLFGFMDDVSIVVGPVDDNNCCLHIKSASRIGRGDFGVNHRRIKRIVKLVTSKVIEILQNHI